MGIGDFGGSPIQAEWGFQHISTGDIIWQDMEKEIWYPINTFFFPAGEKKKLFQTV